MVPLALRFHCWLLPPLQSQIWTFEPAVAPNGTSRHLPSERRVCPVRVQCWLLPPLQSQMIGWVPLVLLAPGTSRQRPDAALTRVDDGARSEEHTSELQS